MQTFRCQSCDRDIPELLISQVSFRHLEDGAVAIIVAKDPEVLESLCGSYPKAPHCAECSMQVLQGLIKVETSSIRETLEILLSELSNRGGEL